MSKMLDMALLTSVPLARTLSTLSTLSTVRLSGQPPPLADSSAMSGESVWYVHDRYEELRGLLESWGWPVSERGDLSEWDEGRRQDPVMGVVRIRGVRDLDELGRASFTVKEWWSHPPADGPLE